MVWHLEKSQQWRSQMIGTGCRPKSLIWTSRWRRVSNEPQWCHAHVVHPFERQRWEKITMFTTLKMKGDSAVMTQQHCATVMRVKLSRTPDWWVEGWRLLPFFGQRAKRDKLLLKGKIHYARCSSVRVRVTSAGTSHRFGIVLGVCRPLGFL